MFLLIYSSTVQIILAGLPPTTVRAGTDFVTIEPAATKAPSPIVTPGIIWEPLPIYTQSPMTIFPKTSKFGYKKRTTCPPHEYAFDNQSIDNENLF